MKNAIKAFIAGIAFPSTILPFGILALHALGRNAVLGIPAVHLIPLAWGVWNVLYFAGLKRVLPFPLDLRLFITGGLLGLLLSIYAVYVMELPTALGFPNALNFLPLIVAPIVYGLVWRYVVKYVNEVVGLKDDE